MEKPKKTETATAIANYAATDDGQICLEEGDFIQIYQKETDDWWYGKNLRGKLEGWFPASYVKVRGGKVGSVAATIGNLVVPSENPDTGNVSKVPIKPPLLPKPMISPKLNLDNLSPRKPSVSQSTSTIIFESEPKTASTQNTQSPISSSESLSSSKSETHFEFKAKLVENVLNRRRSTLYLDDANVNDINNNQVDSPTELDDDDWENEEHEVIEATGPMELVVAIASYEPTGPDQLTLKIGDVVQVHHSADPNWWRGKLKGSNSQVEWFPASYVKSLGKEYQHFDDGPKNGNQVKKSHSMRSILGGPMKILQKVAATAAVMSPTSPHWHAATTPSPKPESTSKFYAKNELITKQNSQQSNDSFESDDSDYGTDQTSIASFSKLYTLNTMGPEEGKSHEKKKDQQRLNIIYELVTTEERYIKDMYFTLTNFQQSLANNGLLSEDEVELIFRNLHQLYEANYTLYDALTARLGTESGVNTRICDILLSHLPTMIAIYKIYICGHTAAKAKVDIKCNDAYFADFLQQVSLENEYFLPLTQYLAKPMQRILQYPNLIEQLLKYTDASNEDYLDCQQAVACAKSFCKELDDLLIGPGTSADWQPYESLSWLQTHLVVKNVTHLIDFNSETQFLGPRTLLYGIFYQNLANRKSIALFLLNDLLILALPQKKLINAHLVTNFFDSAEALNCKYVLYQKPFLLDDITVTSQSIQDTSLELYFNSIGISIKLQATSYEQYNRFMTKFDDAKRNYLEIKRTNNEHVRHSVEFVTTPMAMLSLDSIEAIQLYTRSYTLNAYCKVAIGPDWSHAHSLSITKPIHVDLAGNRSKPVDSKVNSKYTANTRQAISWTTNYLLNIHSADDQLLIRCFNETRFAPHQLLGEATLPVSELIAQSKHLKGFTKGLTLKLPNGVLGEQLLANYQIKPCLLIKFDIL